MIELINAVWTFLELLCLFIVSDSMLKPRENKRIVALVFSLVFGGCFGICNFYTGSLPLSYLSIPLWTLLICGCFHVNVAYVIISLVYFLGLSFITDTIASGCVCFFAGIQIAELPNHAFLYISTATASKAIEAFIAFLFNKISRQFRGTPIHLRWVCLAMLFPAVSILILMILFGSVSLVKEAPYVALELGIAIAAGNIGIVYLIFQLEKSVQANHRTALMTQQMELQSENISALEQNYRKQRKATHEFLHHLEVLDGLLGQMRIDDAEAYIRQLQEQESARIFAINSHNPIIDVILNQKFQTAQQESVDMQVKVNDLSNIPLYTQDLAILLSNLLDNAIEACKANDGAKQIFFTMLDGNPITLSIANTSKPVKIVNGHIPSTKKEPAHGYGLLNVRDILTQLHAEYSIRYEAGWFRFTAEIPKE